MEFIWWKTYLKFKLYVMAKIKELCNKIIGSIITKMK